MASIVPSQMPTFQAATSGGGDVLQNMSGNILLHVKNGGASLCTVTFHAVDSCSQGRVHDAIVNVPAGQERIVGPFRLDRFYGAVPVTYSQVSSVTVAAIPTRIGPRNIP